MSQYTPGHHARAHRPGSARAFTLLEAIATMTIIALIATASSRLLFTATDGLTAAAVRADLLDSGSAAMQRMTSAIRDIPLRPLTSPREPYIDSLDSTSVSWSGNSGLSLSGSTLQLTLAGTTYPLLDNVTLLDINAYDQTGAVFIPPVTGDDCDLIRRIEISITMSRGGVTEKLRTCVFLRCMAVGSGV